MILNSCSGLQNRRCIELAFVAAIAIFAAVQGDSCKGDNLCGPRAVMRVLFALGEGDSPGLPELLDEFSPQLRQNGASVLEIVGILERHGLIATIVEGHLPAIGPHSRIICLVSASDGRSGHYFVLEPRGSEFYIWDGFPEAEQRFLRSQDSGWVCITVSRPSFAISCSSWGVDGGVAAAAGAIAVLLLCVQWAWSHRP